MNRCQEWMHRTGPRWLSDQSSGSGHELGIEGDVGFQEFGDGAAGFGFRGELLEGGLGGARDFGLQGQVDGVDLETALDLLEGDFGGGVHLVGDQFGFAQDEGEGHCEAAGVGGGDELFGVGAALAFEAAGEAVGVGLQGAAFGRDAAFAVFQAAFPGC